jgi:hypothetical protein
MSWNNRIVRKKHISKTKVNGKKTISYTYGIHVAYCDKNGKVLAITKDPVEPHGDTVSDLKKGYLMQADAFTKPVLDYDKIPEEGAIDEWALTEEEKAPTKTQLKQIKVDNEAFDRRMKKFDMEAYLKEQEELRVKDEDKYHKSLKKKK